MSVISRGRIQSGKTLHWCKCQTTTWTWQWLLQVVVGHKSEADDPKLIDTDEDFEKFTVPPKLLKSEEAGAGRRCMHICHEFECQIRKPPVSSTLKLRGLGNESVPRYLHPTCMSRQFNVKTTNFFAFERPIFTQYGNISIGCSIRVIHKWISVIRCLKLRVFCQWDGFL